VLLFVNNRVQDRYNLPKRGGLWGIMSKIDACVVRTAAVGGPAVKFDPFT
jgi:hypothetical protein